MIIQANWCCTMPVTGLATFYDYDMLMIYHYLQQ